MGEGEGRGESNDASQGANGASGKVKRRVRGGSNDACRAEGRRARMRPFGVVKAGSGGGREGAACLICLARNSTMQAQISNARRSLAKQSRAMQKDRQWGCQKQQENKRSAAKIGSLSFSTVNLHQPTSIGKMQASSAEY